MQQIFDKLVGLAMLAVATAVFAYYTIWVFVLPFVDESNVLQSFFLPRDFAIKLPLTEGERQQAVRLEMRRGISPQRRHML